MPCMQQTVFVQRFVGGSFVSTRLFVFIVNELRLKYVYNLPVLYSDPLSLRQQPISQRSSCNTSALLSPTHFTNSCLDFMKL
jgi:hypothetical protein